LAAVVVAAAVLVTAELVVALAALVEDDEVLLEPQPAISSAAPRASTRMGVRVRIAQRP
jgi:hypothetical protein